MMELLGWKKRKVVKKRKKRSNGNVVDFPG
jgi:hypothetical protein